MKSIFKRVLSVGLALAIVFVLVACQSNTETGKGSEDNPYLVGVVGDIEREVWEDVEERLEEEGVHIDVEVFNDYIRPNESLADGSIDMNAFQHIAYLADYVTESGNELVPVGYTYISPMAAYSNSLTSLDDLPEGATVIIPDDVTNGGRALLLLEIAGVIEVDDAASVTPTTNDITSNPKNIVIEEIPAEQVIRTLQDADVVISNTNYAVDAGFDPFEDGIFVDTEHLEEVGSQYKNAIVVRSENAEDDIVAQVLAAYQSEETAAKINEVSNGADQEAWTASDDLAADFDAVLE